MTRDSKYDADKLRNLIEEGRSAGDICQEFGIKKTALNTYLLKLMKADKKFYEISNMDSRMAAPKVTKLGFKISLSKMQSYGFSAGDEVVIHKQDDDSILIKKR